VKFDFNPTSSAWAAQHLGADGMKGAEPLHALDHAADQRADALLHLARRLVGEGDAEDLSRPGLARGEDVSKPRRQNTRLSRSRAGQHEHRAFGREHGLALLAIQPGEIGRFARNRRGLGLGRRVAKSSSSGSR